MMNSYKRTIDLLTNRTTHLLGGDYKIITVHEVSEILDCIEQQEKYAELGRLAVKIASKADWDTCNGIYDNECSERCTWYKFCQKRSELQDV